MKLFCILLVTLPLVCHSFPASADEKSLSLEETDTDSVDTEHAETSNDSQIQKRSGSFDYVSHLKSGLLSSIGHASASIASGSSGGSSGSGASYKSHESGHHGNSVDYDPWSFKKSVLNTIFQAVKAITGGVTALKGQLIKGSGYAISASGGVVANTGDKVTDIGKSIINSAHINSNSYGPSHSSSHGGGSYQHPFAKFSSLSAASSGGSSGSGGGKPSGHGPVIHTETITAYEIPSGHTSYGAPSKPPTYSSATHQYLPPPSNSYGGGGAPFSTGHAAAFEAPHNSYLPASYGHEAPTANDDFNIYGRHKKLTDAEAKKAAQQLQEILSYLPNGKTEFTASKTVTLDTSGSAQHTAHGDEHVDLQSYGLPPQLGHLESLSHTESITAAYNANPSDIYRQMEKQKQKHKQTPEEAYLQKHPEEGYDYSLPQKNAQQHWSTNNNYNSYQSTGSGSGAGSSALDDLTPIIAALEVAKKTPQNSHTTSVNYEINKNVHKYSPQNQFKYLPPVVQKTTHHYNGGGHNGGHYANAIPSREIATYHTVEYHKAKRNAPAPHHQPPQQYRKKRRTAAYTKAIPRRHEFIIEDPVWFNNMLSATGA